MTPRSPAGNVAVFAAFVAGGGDEDNVLRPGVVDGFLKRIAEAGIAERHQNDGRAVVGGPHHALNDVAIVTRTVGGQNFDRHDLNVVVSHAGDSLLVIRVRGNDAGEPGAVAVFIGEAVGGVQNGIAGNDDGTVVKSGCVRSTPVSRIATLVSNLGFTTP